MTLYSIEPLSGSDIRVVITVKGQPIVDTDLTVLYLRAKLAGGAEALPVLFTPFVPAEEDETHEPAQPVNVLLALQIVDENG